METWQSWQAGGRRLTVASPAAPGQSFGIFVRTRGSGPAVTLVHGFPTSSWDWARLEPRLIDDHTVISIDLLGYGHSDRPRGHRYSTEEHADLVQAVWRRLGITASLLVGHDVGTSVARELLAREQAVRGATELAGVVLLNGSLILDHYRPAHVTRLLAHPVTGPLVARAMTEKRYVDSLAALFSDAGRPTTEELVDHWTVLTADDGITRLPRLVHYLADGRRNQIRWRTALLQSPAPLRVLWGAADPAITRPVVEDFRQLMPNTPIDILDEVGHFPQIERPDVVADTVRAMFTPRTRG